MRDDQQLLRDFVAGSEDSFRQLVDRHTNLVYSTALRRMNGDAHLAQDVTQLVFTELARKAPALTGHTALAGWLHQATRHQASQMARSEGRRKAREEKALAMDISPASHEASWNQLRPLLDEALDHLKSPDRDAILLRFFEQRNLAEVGHGLGTSEDTARKRVDRALEKLRTLLGRRGIHTSTSALAVLLGTYSVQSAPVGLAAGVASSALASAASMGGLGLLLFKCLTMSKLSTAAVCLFVAAAPVVYEWRAISDTQERVRTLSRELRETQRNVESERSSLDGANRRLRYANRTISDTQSDIARELARVQSLKQADPSNPYLWESDPQYVRVPKTLASNLRFSGSVEVPVAEGKWRVPEEAVNVDGALAQPLEDALDISPDERAQIQATFQEAKRQVDTLRLSRTYMTNVPPAHLNVGERPSLTQVTEGAPEEAKVIQEQFEGGLVAALGADRAKVLQAQAAWLVTKQLNEFGARTKCETVALGPGTTVTQWEISKLPGEASFSTWGNTSGQLKPKNVSEPFQAFVADWLQKVETKP